MISCLRLKMTCRMSRNCSLPLAVHELPRLALDALWTMARRPSRRSLNEAIDSFAQALPVTRIHGYVTHLQALTLIRSADLLFLPMQNLPPGRRSSTVPGKTYEYLASGRPILGAVPPGDALDLLQRSGHAVCASSTT